MLLGEHRCSAKKVNSTRCKELKELHSPVLNALEGGEFSFSWEIATAAATRGTGWDSGSHEDAGSQTSLWENAGCALVSPDFRSYTAYVCSYLIADAYRKAVP